MKRRILFASAMAMMMAVPVVAKSPSTNGGGLSAETLVKIRSAYEPTAANKAIHNAIAGSDINVLATNADNKNNLDTHFSHRVPSKGITDQKQSGRCWLFTGLNVLRAQMMNAHDLPKLELSQSYNFFWDQLEKANLFLQGIIDTASLPEDDRKVDWLFANALNDGGQYTGVADIIMKYGVVPIEVMGETASSMNTSRMRQLLSWRLREDGLTLRRMAAEGVGKKQLENRKVEMLGEVYRMLALNLGEPPTEFTWTRRDKEGNAVDTRTYTPQEFYQTYAGNDLKGDYVMFMNDPTREYGRLYEIEFDRHMHDGYNWTYVNLPADELKKMAIASIKGNEAMYMSGDVGKFYDRERGVLDPDNYDYGSLFGTTFGMDKADRIRTHSSGSTHAMTLVAVDLDGDGTPKKWLLENSYGNKANEGHLIMTDKWFDEYLFRLVVNRKYITPEAEKILKQQPVLLPPWDPMFAPEE
ncbi:C1 family peptidase [Muribaculum intestinale]|uniref:C1 family peptidase n=1 Tax=Muribaculum intestinale TaxID=1796646 RepID=UPI0026113811|nr:C1 family peptidase [Muribaculum intestinale]